MSVKIRYKSSHVPATLYPRDNQQALLRFEQPQRAVTPGQAAVFYQGEEVLGVDALCCRPWNPRRMPFQIQP